MSVLTVSHFLSLSFCRFVVFQRFGGRAKVCALQPSLGVWSAASARAAARRTANLQSKMLDFGGFDSVIILILRSGILMSIGSFPESLSQAILVGIILAGRLGVA